MRRSGERRLRLATISACALGGLLTLTAPHAQAQDRQPGPAQACSALLHTDFGSIPEAPTQVIAAISMPASRDQPKGQYQPQAFSGTPLVGAAMAQATDLPAYCRITGNIAPQIGFELRLPTTSWNHKLLMQGCGGMCGIINMEAAEDALIRGYAVVNTNMGHTGSAAITNWGADKLLRVDFGWRATHVVALAAKQITQHFYGEAPRRSYFRGYSTGGDQALSEAQRFPYDFDGIIAGAPVSGGAFPLVWSAQTTMFPDGRTRINPDKLAMIHRAVMKACGGEKDNFIENPQACGFKPDSLRCTGTVGPDCLNAEEVGVVSRLYAGARAPDGFPMSMGVARGSELEWLPLYVAPGKPTPWNPDGSRPIWASPMVVRVLRDVELWSDPGPLDLVTYNLSDFYLRKKLADPLRYDLNPDLREFKAHGGRLLMFQGWNDPEVQPFATLDYYQTATRTMGGPDATRSFFRLFMIPGMAHTRGGEGADAIDYLSSLENWVEHDHAPDNLVSYHLRTPQNYMGLPVPRYPLPADRYDWSRPIFAYPEVAVWDGAHDRSQVASWKPVTPAAR